MRRPSHPLHELYRHLGPRYPLVAVVLVVVQGHVVVAASVGVLARFVTMPASGWLLVLAVGQLLALIESLYVVRRVCRALRPVEAWHRDPGDQAAAVQSWRILTDLPGWQIGAGTAVRNMAFTVPLIAVICLEGDLAVWPSALALALAASVVVAAGVLVRFLELDLVLRPAVEAVAPQLPDGAALPSQTVSLRWRVMITVPLITLVTGAIVAGYSTGGGTRGLSNLGVGFAVALAATATIALALSAVLARSLVSPLRAVQQATDAVARGDLTRRAPVLGGDEVGELARSFNGALRGLRERERLHEALGAYVDPALAGRLLTEGPRIPAEPRDVSVAFIDIRGFTAFSEGASAHDVFALLNEFYGVVVPVVESYGGTANAFQGDGLLAVFGTPVDLREHADAAVAASIAVARAVRAHFAGKLHVGIGVNSGPVVAGTLGGGGRVAFSVIGDAVNTASRVESVTRETGDVVLMTEDTRALLRGDHGTISGRPSAPVHGKSTPVRLHAPLLAGRVDDPLPELEDRLERLVEPDEQR